MQVHHLHEPIDVFSQWLDDCQAAANPRGADAAAADEAEPRYDDLDDDDDDLPEGSGMAARSPSQKKPAASAKSSKDDKAIDLGLSSGDEDDEE
jgi:hypothetical protein